MLAVNDLTHIYSIGTPFEHAAIEHVSFTVEQGEFIGLIGHTGSGKSTLIQHLNGLLKPTSGEILFHGKNIWESTVTIRQTRFQIGLVFQYPEYQLFEETVYKDIAFGPKNMGLDQDEIHRRVLRASGFVGLPFWKTIFWAMASLYVAWSMSSCSSISFRMTSCRSRFFSGCRYGS